MKAPRFVQWSGQLQRVVVKIRGRFILVLRTISAKRIIWKICLNQQDQVPLILNNFRYVYVITKQKKIKQFNNLIFISNQNIFFYYENLFPYVMDEISDKVCCRIALKQTLRLDKHFISVDIIISSNSTKPAVTSQCFW